MATVRIGDHELTRDQARDLTRDYAIRYRATVLRYDLAGDDTDRPDRASATQPVNTVGLKRCWNSPCIQWIPARRWT